MFFSIAREGAHSAKPRPTPRGPAMKPVDRHHLRFRDDLRHPAVRLPEFRYLKPTFHMPKAMNEGLSSSISETFTGPTKCTGTALPIACVGRSLAAPAFTDAASLDEPQRLRRGLPEHRPRACARNGKPQRGAIDETNPTCAGRAVNRFATRRENYCKPLR